jgi:hypothetical protein
MEVHSHSLIKSVFSGSHSGLRRLIIGASSLRLGFDTKASLRGISGGASSFHAGFLRGLRVFSGSTISPAPRANNFHSPNTDPTEY